MAEGEYEMTLLNLKLKKTVFVLLLSASLLFGTGLLTPAFGVDAIPSAYACAGGGSSSGGGC